LKRKTADGADNADKSLCHPRPSAALTFKFVAFCVDSLAAKAKKGLNEENRKAGKEVRRASPFLLSCFPHESFRAFAVLSGKVAEVCDEVLRHDR
jgi:hypothetical protein